MKNWNQLSKEEQLKLYNETMSDIDGCCDPWVIDFKEADGICPECGRVTSNGMAICGCDYSPKYCEYCGAAPCDLSC